MKWLKSYNYHRIPKADFLGKNIGVRSRWNAEMGKCDQLEPVSIFCCPPVYGTHWHRVQSDENWHFYKGNIYKGNKLMLEIIGRKGNFHQKILHNDFQGGGSFQKLVPENC